MRILIAVATLLCVFSSQASAEGKTFVELLHDIEEQTHHSSNIYDLCLSNTFTEMHSNPERYWPDFIKCVQTKDLDHHLIINAICIMQGLTTDRYADLCDECLDLYLQNKIEEIVLHCIFFPPHAVGHHMIKFKNKKVFHELNKAMNLSHDYYFKDDLNKAITGNALYDYMESTSNNPSMLLDCDGIK